MTVFPGLQLLLLLLLSTSVVTAAPSVDEILSLPGLQTQPNFRQYSGYLWAGGKRWLHYWFVESANKPSTDPVAVWLNGGPGCSSLLGLLTENGPFTVQEDGVSLEYNPFSWNTVANMLYIESPAGVGFSYAVDKNYTTSDDVTADENFMALTNFFTKFPEYRSNELFITGESYAGIYVPMLTARLLGDSRFNLKGYLLGNGVSSNEFLGDSLMYFAYYHGLIGTEEWVSMLKACCGGDANNCKFTAGSQRSQACYDQVDKVNAIIEGGFFNVYNLYAPCDDGVANHRRAHNDLLDWIFGFHHKRNQTSAARPGRVSAERSCDDQTAITTYTNLPEVRRALNIPSFVQNWINCVDYEPGWYTKIYNNTAPFYYKIFKAGIRGLLYNGDVDMSCNFLGDEWFVDSLQRPVKEARRMWFYTDNKGLKQVAGFVKTFDLITYATVRGSGHMVPTDRPRPALVIFTNFIQNKPL